MGIDKILGNLQKAQISGLINITKVLLKQPGCGMKTSSVNIMASLKKAFLVLPVLTAVLFHSNQAHAGILDDILNGAGSILNGVNGAINQAFNVVGGVFDALGLGWLFNDLISFLFGSGACGQKIAGGVGEVLCNVIISTSTLPALITGIAYGMGLLLSVVAIFKLKEHVINPDRTPLSDSMKRFVAGGALFAIPSVARAAQELITGTSNSVPTYDQSGGFAGDVAASGGLDSMMTMLVADIWLPLQTLLSAFAYLAGLVFLVIGIGRLLKTAQDGPRGPAGVGTIMTFVTAGILFSLDNLMGAFSMSMFGDNDIATYAVLADTTGDTLVDRHITGVISAVLGFMILVGWISFLRGFFILRDVAEGNGQASLMAATTHMFGGALAVNLGPVMNAVQNTLGIGSFGVCFENGGFYC